VVALLMLPVRLVVVLAKLVALPFIGITRGARWLAPRLGRGVLALLLLPVRIVVLLAKLVALPVVGIARALAWLAPRAGRGFLALLLLPVRVVILLARLVAILAKGLGKVAVFTLRIPFVALRLAGRGASAVAIPALALSWGTVRWLAAGVAAVVRAIAISLAFLGRLALRGVVALLRGGVAGVGSLALGLYACVRLLARAVVWAVLLPLLALRFLVVGLARGVRNLAGLLAGAAVTVATGIAQLVRGVGALLGLLGGGVARAAKPVSATIATREAGRAGLLPLATLAVLGGAELLGPGSFPFATLGLLLLAAFASLALLPKPTGMGAVLLAWALAVAAMWRAESVTDGTTAWMDALVYVATLAALRSAYVAARSFAREAPVAWRDDVQARAHRRAARAIGIVVAAQCVAFAVWSGVQGRFPEATLFAELLLVGAGIALAWVVRSGRYVGVAQAVLSLAALVALVGVIAAQFTAFAAGHLVTPASLGAALGLLLVASALTVVIHTREVNG
jgi:hypothetical protein